ncbi:hypothetical protein D3C81_1930080 [compost metagenome]
MLAQAQDGLLRAQRTLQAVVLPVAHGAEQDGIGLLGQLQRVLGQRMAFGLVAGAAHGRRFQFECLVEGVEHLDGFGNDLGTNAVARQDCNLHLSSCIGGVSRAVSRPGDCPARASSSGARLRTP